MSWIQTVLMVTGALVWIVALGFGLLFALLWLTVFSPKNYQESLETLNRHR